MNILALLIFTSLTVTVTYLTFYGIGVQHASAQYGVITAKPIQTMTVPPVKDKPNTVIPAPIPKERSTVKTHDDIPMVQVNNDIKPSTATTYNTSPPIITPPIIAHNSQPKVRFEHSSAKPRYDSSVAKPRYSQPKTKSRYSSPSVRSGSVGNSRRGGGK